MKRFAMTVLALPLMAFRCGGPPAIGFPVLPDLSAETVKACPPLPLVTGSLGDLASKDAAAAVEYARCRARAATAVGAYQDAQAKLAEAGRQAKAGSGTKPRP